MNRFKIGQKVVCTRATGFLIEGVEYTVDGYADATNAIGLRVKECLPTPGFAGYREDRFEPVDVEVTLQIADLQTLSSVLEILDTINLNSYAIESLKGDYAYLVNRVNFQLKK